MTELETKVLEAQQAYYNKEPIMSDEEYDILYDKLKEENPSSEVLKKIGEDNIIFNKEEHIMNMNSLEKVNNEEDYLDWHKRKVGDDNVVVQYKMDGISLELQYRNGEFLKAVTRGNGKVGDNISQNVVLMKGFASKLDNIKNKPFSGAIRGEIILDKESFKEHFEPQGLKNPRNTASGLSKQKVATEELKHLSILVYDIEHETDKDFFPTENEKIYWLEKSSDKLIVSYSELFETAKEAVSKWKEIAEKRETLNIPIDGLVIKKNTVISGDRERDRPEFQIAFKFKSEFVTTEVIDVEWSLSGKNLTPVAIVEPVEILGTTVKRASLHNPNYLNDLNLGVGDEVIISKRGEIIPQIESVAVENKDGKKFKPPTSITFQGRDWETVNDGSSLTIEDKDFPLIRLSRIKKWISTIGAKGFGDVLINDLFNNGWINDIDGLYSIDLIEYLKSTNLKAATKKAFKDLYEVKEIELHEFLAGLNIDDIGKRVFKTIVDAGYDTLDKILSVKEKELILINGIGEARAKVIVNGLKDFSILIKKLADDIIIKEAKVKNKETNKTFCFTGALESMTRGEAANLVEKAGGKVTSSITTKTDYLVTNTPGSGSAKNKKALECGTKIINEQEFLKIVSGE